MLICAAVMRFNRYLMILYDDTDNSCISDYINNMDKMTAVKYFSLPFLLMHAASLFKPNLKQKVITL